MVKIIHKNIYSNRLKTVEELEPYDYEIQDDFTINSFMIFLSKFPDESLLLQSIKDFCETKRTFISDYTENYMIHNQTYYDNQIKYYFKELLSNYETIDMLDFLDICINNIDKELQKYKQLYEKAPYPFNNKDVIALTGLKKSFIDSLNEVFEHNNLGYVVINDVIATKKSDFLHVETISKPLTLLVIEEFNGPLEEFKKAIDNYTHKDYENTVIEVCKAFESTMKAVLDKLRVEYNHDKPTAKGLISLLKDNGIFDSFQDDNCFRGDSLSKNCRLVLPEIDEYNASISWYRGE